MAFTVKETKTTPLIEIDKGVVTIKGRSIPEDAFEFYEPVLEACKEYVRNPPKHTEITVELDYVNSGSKKYLTNILTVFEQSYLEVSGYNISWCYDEDDEAMLDLGNDLKGILKIPLEVKASY